MMQYVKIKERFDRFEEIDDIVTTLVDSVEVTGIEIAREYPKGYSSSTDGFIIVRIPDTLILSGQTKDLLIAALKTKPAKGSYPLDVRLVIEHDDMSTKLIFSVPDVWVKMDAPSYSESLKGEK